MQKNISKYKIATISMLSVVAILSLLVVGVKNAGAQSDQADPSSSNGNSSNTEAGSNSAAQAKLQGRNLENCQNREMAINSVMARVGDRGQKQLELVESIQGKIQSFYSNKNVSVLNYDELVSNIEAKKQLALTAINTVRTMNGSFSCSKDNPKGIATQFKSQASGQSSSIKDYRDAVRELATAIKVALSDVTSTTEGN
jgi:hypothetical protein